MLMTERSLEEWIEWYKTVDKSPTQARPFDEEERLAEFSKLYLNNGEPALHSFITDVLPDGHPLQWETVYCVVCKVTVHCSNECMYPWLETNTGAYCFPHWWEEYDADEPHVDLRLGLKR